MDKKLVRISRIVALAGGSIAAVVGILWSLLYVDHLTDQAHTMSSLRDDIVERARRITVAEEQYFTANQQGDLIFILALQPNARRDLASSIYAGNMYDRATPVRAMIGGLVRTRLLDYNETNTAYQALVDKARQTQTLETFQAVKAMERDIIQRGQQQEGELMKQQFLVRQGLTENDTAQLHARIVGGVISILSTLLLLLASIITKRHEEPAASVAPIG